MSCEVCGRMEGHDKRCPHYIPPQIDHYCSNCGDGIFDGEKYVRNDDMEYRHFDCIYDIKELVQWLGFQVDVMEDYR